MRILFLLPLLGLTAAAPPAPANVTLTVDWLTNANFELVLEPSPALTFNCTLVPQGGGAVLKLCKASTMQGRPILLKAHRHFLRRLPSGKVDVPVANSEWTNACAGTMGEVCKLPMAADTTAEMKFTIVN